MFTILTSLFLLVSGAVFLLLIYKREDRNSSGPVPSPGLVSSSVLFVYYCIPAFINSLWPEISLPRRFYFGYTVETYILCSLTGLLAMSCQYLGYATGIRTITRRPFLFIGKIDEKVSNLPWQLVFFVSVLFFILGFMVNIYKQMLGFIHYAGILEMYERSSFENHVLSILVSFQYIGYYMVVYYLSKGIMGLFRKFISILICVAQIANSLFSGGALPLIISAMPFFLLFVHRGYFYKSEGYSTASLNKRTTIFHVMVWGFVITTTAFIFKSISRNLHFLGAGASLYDTITNIDLLVESIGSIQIMASIEAILTSGVDSGTDSFAAIYTKIKYGELSFLWGEPYSLFMVSFIPRFIYPDKPDVALGMWFTDNIWRDWVEVSRIGTGLQSTGFMLPGDFYLNFGIVGVILGTFIVGFFISFFSQRFFYQSGVGVITFSYITFLYFNVVHYLYSFVSYLTAFIRSFLISTIIFIILILACHALVIFYHKGTLKATPL